MFIDNLINFKFGAMSLERQPCHVFGKADMVFQKDKSQVLTAGSDGLIKLFDINSESYLQEYDFKEEIHCLTIDPKDESQIILGTLMLHFIIIRLNSKIKSRSI